MLTDQEKVEKVMAFLEYLAFQGTITEEEFQENNTLLIEVRENLLPEE